MICHTITVICHTITVICHTITVMPYHYLDMSYHNSDMSYHYSDMSYHYSDMSYHYSDIRHFQELFDCPSHSVARRPAVPIVRTSFTNIIPGNSAKCSDRAARSTPRRFFFCFPPLRVPGDGKVVSSAVLRSLHSGV